MSQCYLEYQDGCLSLVGEFPAKTKKLQCLNQYGHIEKLSLAKQTLLTAKLARHFSNLQSVQWLWLWCSVARTAMKHIITIPKLETLDILELKHGKRLKNFSEATMLKVFRCNYLSENDLLEIAKLPVLQQFGAQHSEITQRALNALLQIPTLEDLDLETSIFDDKMATMIAESNTIQHLAIGASKLTSQGLKKISKMTQLRSLDIWAIDIVEADLECLSNLCQLEYLSIGGYDDQTLLTAKGVLSYLKKIPALKRIWLDGIVFTEQEKQALNAQYEYVKISHV